MWYTFVESSGKNRGRGLESPSASQHITELPLVHTACKMGGGGEFNVNLVIEGNARERNQGYDGRCFEVLGSATCSAMTNSLK